MKKLITAIIITTFVTATYAQVALNDFGRIIINTYLPENLNIPSEARGLLLTKLNQITSNNGIGGSQANSRFIITANVNIVTKDIIAGPPQMIAQNLEITLFIGDAISNTIFSNTIINLKGVGTNENKAFIDAIKNINPKNKEVLAFLDEGKSKIISYYSTQCDFILQKANTFASQYKFEEAIYSLMIVPETCKDCYLKCQDQATVIFTKKIESDCTEKLKEAKTIWASEPTKSGAEKTTKILITIIPSDNCKEEISKVSTEIKMKLEDYEKKKYDLDMLERKQMYDTEQKRIDVFREIALEQAKQQPKEIIYNHIIWK
jgi:predicted Rdx family selenoprotein